MQFSAFCRSFFTGGARRCAGAAVRDGTLYLAGIERTAAGGTFSVALLESVFFPSGADGRLDASALAAKIYALLAQHGWENERLLLALPAGRAVYARAALPDLSARALRETALWEMVARHPELSPPFPVAVRREGADSLIAALDAGRAKELEETCRAAGLRLSAFCLPPENFLLDVEENVLRGEGFALPVGAALCTADGTFTGWDDGFSTALYGPLCAGLRQDGLLFPLEAAETENIAYGRVAALLAAACFFVLLCVTFYDGIRCYEARQEAARLRAELALVAPERAAFQKALAARADETARERKLHALTLESPPAAALLAQIGTATVPGVRFTGARILPAGRVELSGVAADFGALSGCLGALAADGDFFSGTPALEKSARDPAGGLAFSIALGLPEGAGGALPGEGAGNDETL